MFHSGWDKWLRRTYAILIYPFSIVLLLTSWGTNARRIKQPSWTIMTKYYFDLFFLYPLIFFSIFLFVSFTTETNIWNLSSKCFSHLVGYFLRSILLQQWYSRDLHLKWKFNMILFSGLRYWCWSLFCPYQEWNYSFQLPSPKPFKTNLWQLHWN